MWVESAGLGLGSLFRCALPWGRSHVTGSHVTTPSRPCTTSQATCTQTHDLQQHLLGLAQPAKQPAHRHKKELYPHTFMTVKWLCFKVMGHHCVTAAAFRHKNELHCHTLYNGQATSCPFKATWDHCIMQQLSVDPCIGHYLRLPLPLTQPTPAGVMHCPCKFQASSMGLDMLDSFFCSFRDGCAGCADGL